MISTSPIQLQKRITSRRQNNDRAVGQDNVPSELLKYAGNRYVCCRKRRRRRPRVCVRGMHVDQMHPRWSGSISISPPEWTVAVLRRGIAPGPTLLEAQEGPAHKRKSGKTFRFQQKKKQEIRESRMILVDGKFWNNDSADDFSPGPRNERYPTWVNNRQKLFSKPRHSRIKALAFWTIPEKPF